MNDRFSNSRIGSYEQRRHIWALTNRLVTVETWGDAYFNLYMRQSTKTQSLLINPDIIRVPARTGGRVFYDLTNEYT